VCACVVVVVVVCFKKMDAIQENKFDKLTKLKWGNVFFREYARYVGGGCGVPEDEGSEWPLGISDSIVVYDESGHVKGAVKAFSSGTEHVPIFYGDEEEEKNAHISSSPLKAESTITSFGNNSDIPDPLLLSSSSSSTNDNDKETKNKMIDNTTQMNHQTVTGTSGSSGSSGSSFLQSSSFSRALLPGEQYGGTVEEYDVKLSLYKQEREEAALKALTVLTSGKKKKKKRQSTTAASANVIGWKSLSPIERKRLFLENNIPLAIPMNDLVITNEETTSELREIVENRRESNTGCSCALFSRDILANQPVTSLRARCILRGVASEGGKRALIMRLVEHSKLHPGCMRGVSFLKTNAETPISSTSASTETPISSTSASTETPISSTSASTETPISSTLASTETTLSTFSSVTEVEAVKAQTNLLPSIPLPPLPPSRKRKRSLSNSDGVDDLNLESGTLSSQYEQGSTSLSTKEVAAETQSIKSETNAFVDSLATLARAHKSALQLSQTLLIPDTVLLSSTSDSNKSFCPCEAAGLGCHFNTCACDSDCCSNLPFGDPSAAAYDDGGIFVSRDIIMRMTKESDNLFFSPEDCKRRRNEYLQDLEDQVLKEMTTEEENAKTPTSSIHETPLDAFQCDALKLIQAALGGEGEDEIKNEDKEDEIKDTKRRKLF
jgi:hypothetical protein